MGKKTSSISNSHRSFIESQQIWFVATSAPGARINLSPKGLDSLRILNDNQVIWLNLVGSGNETAAHLLEDDRMTLMFCSFDKNPMILRLYGHANAIHPGDAGWDEAIAHFDHLDGARQLIDMHVDLTHTSCGFGIPLFEFKGKRDSLPKWINKKGEDGLRAYQLKNNITSLDGRPTGLQLENSDLHND